MTLQDTLKKFDEGIEHLWHKNISGGADDEITFNEQDIEKIKSFITQEIKTALESVVPYKEEYNGGLDRLEEKEDISFTDIVQGYNACRAEMLKNIDKFLNN